MSAIMFHSLMSFVRVEVGYLWLLAENISHVFILCYIWKRVRSWFFFLLNQGNFLIITVSHRCKSQICNPLLNSWNSRRNFSVEQVEWWSYFFNLWALLRERIAFSYKASFTTISYHVPADCHSGVPAFYWVAPDCVCKAASVLRGNRVFSVSTGKQIRHLCHRGSGDGLTRSMGHYGFPSFQYVLLWHCIKSGL